MYVSRTPNIPNRLYADDQKDIMQKRLSLNGPKNASGNHISS